MSALPTTAKAPTPLSDSGPVADAAGRASWVQDSIDTAAFIAAMSPTSATLYDTGWLAPTLAVGSGSSGFGFIRRGGHVGGRGAVAPATNWGAAGSLNTIVAAGGLPVDQRPAFAQAFIAPGNAPSTGCWFRVAIGADGSISVRCSVANSTEQVWFSGIGYDV